MVVLDDEWEQMPIAELHQLDALCDQFEQSIARDPETRVERFLASLPTDQQQCLVRELVTLEIEKRKSRGESVKADEYGSRFPQWTEEIQALASQTIEDVDRALIAKRDTIDQTSSSGIGTETAENDLRSEWRRQWEASSESARHFDLPADGVLGHYRLQSVIGRGGMGLVVRAHDTKLHRDVAIKVLASTFSHDQTAHERFLREARAAAAVRHTHVVTIYAVEEIDRIPFLVMELVEGRTLEEHLRANGKLPADEVARLACQMAQGLAAAHKQGLIHRDVKPANILLERVDQHGSDRQRLSTWHIKITDFGLARIAAEAQLTKSGLIAGTPQYMSPEQANGQELDARSDLFSLGSVMYAMCAGRTAFEAESAIAIVRQVADKPAPSLREVSPETPDWLIE
ncbi:MAG: serine/threonine protein kinase, partial [Rhodopirellula sp.]|nr:serine/threonine protein kinase [Rhodopirellula sp.]